MAKNEKIVDATTCCRNAYDKTYPFPCASTPDERYTMRFDDIGQPPILWCSLCGPEAHATHKALEDALKSSPELCAKFESALTSAECEVRASKS